MWKQPRSVWAVAFACVIAFMGIGLVDPILPAISEELQATPSQTMLLFTSYLFVTGLAMFFTSFVSSRIGAKKTLLLGLGLIVVFAALAGASGSVNQIIGFRGGWGLGNALFLSTALSAIVGAAAGGAEKAIVLYEAALGLGIATGPLLGGALGEISWRGPFFGTAALMAIGFIAIVILLKTDPNEAKPEPVKLSATFRALAHPGILVLGVAAFFYNFGFFILLAYSPFPLEAAAASMGMEFGAHELGLVFFGWGICLAITSAIVAPLLTKRFSRRGLLVAMEICMAVVLLVMGLNIDSLVVLIVSIIVGGLFLGVINTVLTEAAMAASDLPRAVASGTYSGVRFLGGAMAPLLAGPMANAFGAPVPYFVGAAAVVVSILIFVLGRGPLARIENHKEETELEAELTEAYAITGGDA